MIESSKEEFIRLTESTANIAHIDGADRLLNESQADVIELISAEKEDSPVLVDVSESISSVLKAQDILITIEDHDVIANKTIKELPASIEEFDLFEGIGIPVYLPEFDLFGRIHKELETRITLFEDASKLSRIMQTQIDQTAVSEKVEKELITIVNEEVDSNIVPVTLDAQCINLDESYKQNTQQALITEQEAFIGIREFEGGVISDITPADKEVIETIDLARESEQYAIVSEYELLERQNVVEAVTSESDTFDREHELESVTEEYERFERKPERESVLEDTEQFKLERVLDTEKPDELIVIEKENDDPKLWLRHSRQSWWTNSNWKKTR
ncbi:hypothetical protein QCI46_28680 [Bacillus cereus group sp. RP32]